MYYNPLAIPVYIVWVITSVMMIIALRRPDKQEGLYLDLLVGASACYFLFYSLELSTSDPEMVWFFHRLEYVGSIFLGPLLLFFSWSYTQQKQKLTTRKIGGILFVPAILLIALWTNGFHHNFYIPHHIHDEGLHEVSQIKKGPLYWVHELYTLLLIIISMIHFLRMLRNVPDRYYSQIIIVILGCLSTCLIHGINLLGFFPPQLQHLSFSFFFIGTIMPLSIMRFRFLDMRPIPYKLIFKNISDGLLVTDDQNRIVGMNPSARQMLRVTERKKINSYNTVLDKWPHLANAINQQKELFDLELESTDQIGNPVWISVDLLPNIERGTFVGMTVFLRNSTQWKQDQRELRRIQELLTQTSSLAKVGGWEADLEQKTMFWTDMTKEIHEIPRSHQPNQLEALQFYKEGENRDKIEAAVHQATTYGTSQVLELELVTAKGKTLWVRTSVVPEWKDGSCNYIYGTIQDIDKQKRAELALSESENQLQSIIATMQEGIMVHDVAGRLIDCNRSAERILGLSLEEMKTSLNQNESYLTDRNGNLLNIQQYPVITTLKTKKNIHDSTIGVKIKDQSIRWLSVNTVILTLEGKSNIHGVLVTFSDISERIKIVNELDEARKLLRNVFDSMTEAVWALKPETQEILYISKAIVEIFEVDFEEVQKDLRVLENFYHPDQPNPTQQIQEQLQEKGQFEIEYRIITPSGKTKWVNSTGRFISNHDSSSIRLDGMIQDITRRKELELSLIQAKEQAELASKAKSDFLANMTHEIRTPLNGVIGFSDLLLKTNLKPNQEEYANSVNQSGMILLNLINDILDFSKIEAGKLELNIERTDLWAITEQATDLIKFKVAEKKMNLFLNIDPKMPRYAWVDPVRLRQVIINLLSNASKFTNQGEIELATKVIRTQGQHATTIEFSVRDTGIGIPKEQQKIIFDAFSQADTSVTRKYGGTGLGLTISRKLLKLMDTELNLESEPGKGSKFYFSVQVPTETGDLSTLVKGPLPQKVLLISSSKVQAGILKNMLNIHNIKSTIAKDGISALLILEKAKNNFDLGIIDFNLSAMDGITVAEKIRSFRKESISNLPLILLHNTPNDRKLIKACTELGIQQQFNKPLSIKRLYDALNRLQNNQQYEENISGNEKLLPATEGAFQILVVDDHPMNLLLAKTLLKRIFSKAQILEATNGLEAIQVFQQQGADLILMDIQMPELSGYEATKEIRRWEKKYNKTPIPIVALTAGTVQGEKERCQAAGMNDYLSKPIVAKKLKENLNKYLFNNSTTKV